MEYIVKVGGAIPGISDSEITECAGDQLGNKVVCSRNKELTNARDFLKLKGVKTKETSPKKIIQDLMKILGVSKESEIYENREYRSYLGDGEAKKVLQDLFKPIGPADNTKLLSNYNIDGTMLQWSQHGKELFNKKFYNIPFQMIDFEQEKTELSGLDIQGLISQKYNSFGVVINTDVNSGRGKHWFCLYGDLEHKSTKEDPIQLEYFNSSGNKPMEEITLFLEKTRADLLKNHKIYSEIVHSVVGTQIQQSKTECGMWSLLYIWSRLMGHPTNWLLQVQANDNEVIEARAKFFRN